jgi:3-dehydroquinate synthetase
LGLTDKPLVARGVRALRELGLPVELHKHPVASAVELIAHDKKRAGSQVRFVVAREVGRVELVDLGLEELKAHAAALVA